MIRILYNIINYETIHPSDTAMKLPKELSKPTAPYWCYFAPSDSAEERFAKVLNIGRIKRQRHGGYSSIREATGLDNAEIDLCVEVLEAWERRDVEEAL